MFTNEQFKYCVEGLKRTVEQLICGAKNKRLAILLAHNDQDKAKLVGFKSTIQEAYTSLDRLLQMEPDELEQGYMSNKVDLASFFLLCKREFHESSSTAKRKVLLFFTNSDDPVKDDIDKKGRLLTEAANFAPLNIKLVVTALNEDFDYRLFYSEVLEVAHSFLSAECCSDADGVYYKLLGYIRGDDHGQKFKFYMHEDDSELFFYIRIKGAVKEQKFLSNCMVTRNRNEQVKKVCIDQQSDGKCTVNICTDETLEVNEDDANKLRDCSVRSGFTLLCVSDDLREKGMSFTFFRVLYLNGK